MSQLELLAYDYSKRRATYRVVGAPRTFVTFHKSDDLTDEELAEREALASDMASFKTRRKSGVRRVNHELARQRGEHRGLEALALPDRDPPTPARKFIVRVYYRSEAGELLCFDAGPLTRQAAESLRSEYQARQVFVPDERPASKRRKARSLDEMYRDAEGSVPSAEMFDRDEIGADAIAQGRYRKPGHGARLVVLPSQIRERESADTK